MNKGTFRCASGKHEYSEKLTFDKHGLYVNRCKHCKLHGYYELFNGKVIDGMLINLAHRFPSLVGGKQTS